MPPIDQTYQTQVLLYTGTYGSEGNSNDWNLMQEQLYRPIKEATIYGFNWAMEAGELYWLDQ